MKLPAFQREAVRRILERFKRLRGSRRFLLADEVGLGKTHVAKGVIEGLRHKRKPLVVFYISSNREIAHQNRRKLAQVGAEEPVDDRLTLFAKHVRPSRRLAPGAVRLLTLTPGTSLFLGRSTGVSEERLLILYLIRRLRPHLFRRKNCRMVFKCGVRKERAWRSLTRWPSLRKRFPARLDVKLQRHLRREWGKPLKQLDALSRSGTKSDRKQQNAVIGELRRGLARAVVQALEPSLIVLDEFQRFRELIQREAKPPNARPQGREPERHVLWHWFFDKPTECPPILMLSATPYRLYSSSPNDADEDAHLKELFEVLSFVAGVEPGDAKLAELKRNLTSFRERIEGLPSGAGRDPELLALKQRIETALKQWMCRTERNWYYADELKGVEGAKVGEEQWPQRQETVELKELSQLLVQSGTETGAQVIDYWKSSPAPLSFMFDQYEVQRRLGRMRGSAIRSAQRRLLTRPEDISSLHTRNLKLRSLVRRLFEQSPSETNHSAKTGGPRRWQHLWCPPNHGYWRAGIQGGDGKRSRIPEKFLVFSHWRFVPGAIGLVLSQMVERGLGYSSSAAWQRVQRAEPLRFRQDTGVGLFDVCFPSIGLAEVVDTTAIALALLAQGAGRSPNLAEVEATAARILKERLEEVGVQVTSRSRQRAVRVTSNVWQVVARLDAAQTLVVTKRGLTSWLPEMLSKHRPTGSRERPEAQSYEVTTIRRYRDWVEEGSEGSLQISPRLFRRLVKIAIHSPAVSLLRAVRRAVPAAPPETWYGAALTTGFSGVRNYFNRVFARAIVDRHARGNLYADRVLNYCASTQLQAVWDEYTFLLAEQEASVDRKAPEVATAMLRDVLQVLSLGLGAPRVRVRKSGRGQPWRTEIGRSHFALAFAEDSEDGGGRSRRRHTREAFNSPFWPFVLATTSVGQEGLDFHWYCRNVVHWNLPSNPVDLEQREGRVNRRNGLVVRRSLSHDISLCDVARSREPSEGVWPAAFRLVKERMAGVHHERHGLFPHWLYEARGSLRSSERIRRHEFSYWGSRDRVRYERLKQDLALYRLVFGQVNQVDLLARLREKVETVADGSRGLEAYMLNLAPFPKGAAWKAARQEAAAKLREADVRWVRTLLKDSRQILAKYRVALGSEAVEAGRVLLARVSAWFGHRAEGPVPGKIIVAAAALTYLRNPYDDRFDVHRLVGFEDDAKRLIEVANTR